MTENEEKAIWIAVIGFLIFITGGMILLLLPMALPWMLFRAMFGRLHWSKPVPYEEIEKQRIYQDLEILAHSQQRDLEAIQDKEGHGGY